MMKNSSVALGNFDGIHLGHSDVLNDALRLSKKSNTVPVALLFEFHPRINKDIKLLMTEDDKRSAIEKMGIKPVYISFDEVKDYSPVEFTEIILINKLSAVNVCCGYNYHFGKNASGTVKDLKEICEEKNIVLSVSEKHSFSSESISSSRIRKLLADGEIELCNKMLNSPFSYCLEVVHGQQRGKLMGFPTINQYFPKELIIPKFGVYASKTEIDRKLYPSFTDIGFRPTFEDDDVRSETHIFDYDGDLYGKKIRVFLLKFIREERKFSGLDDLAHQLKIDKENILKCL